MAVIFSEGDRVQVTNQSLDTCGMFGTVKQTDEFGTVWVRLDGYPLKRYGFFQPGDLSGGKEPSILLYGDEETSNPYIGFTGPVG